MDIMSADGVERMLSMDITSVDTTEQITLMDITSADGVEVLLLIVAVERITLNGCCQWI